MLTSDIHQTDEQLRWQLQAGLDALDSGCFTELDDSDLDAALDNFASPTR